MVSEWEKIVEYKRSDAYVPGSNRLQEFELLKAINKWSDARIREFILTYDCPENDDGDYGLEDAAALVSWLTPEQIEKELTNNL